MNPNPLPKTADVAVVGAGPAGSFLAYGLARAGVRVVLLDKAKFPRGKTCGGGINVRARKLIPFDFSPIVEATITGISFSRQFEESFTRRYPAPLLFTVRRDRFDEFLARRAEEAGACFRDHTPVLSVEAKSQWMEVKTQSGSFSAAYIAGADGAQSLVARKMGLLPSPAGMRVFHGEAPASLGLEWDPSLIRLDWGGLKRSYAYLFPKKFSFSLGAGGIGVPPGRLKGYQRAFQETCFQKEQTIPLHLAGFMIPLRKNRSPICAGRSLLVGDAAGLADPFTGEGIFSALKSAQIASSVMQEALRNRWDSLQCYQEAIERELMPELDCSRLFRELFNLRPGYFHRKIASQDRWWNAMAKILRGEKTFLDIGRKLGLLGSLLLRMAR